MTTDHSPSLDEIREAAEKAKDECSPEWETERSLSDFVPALATYIAMMDPQTTLGLLDRLAVAEANVQAQSDAEQKQYDRSERAEELVSVLGEALEAVKHDRPTAHADRIWERLNSALDAARAFTEANPSPGGEEQ